MREVRQAEFARAILDPLARTPAGLANPDGSAARRRFDVYRNNVVGGLVGVLESGFPVLRRLLGPDRFRSMAVLHARQCPPRTPLMMCYGVDLPGFLEGFEPVAGQPWLPDLARLELALRRAYHAADAEPMAVAAIAGISPESLPAQRMRLAPSVELVRSRWSIHGIWRAAGGDDSPPSLPARLDQREDVLVTRPQFDPEPHLLAPGAAACVAALRQGRRIGDAVEAGLAESAEFDLTALLGILLAGGALVELGVALDATPEAAPGQEWSTEGSGS